jgi:hypothetical protein
MAVEAVMKMLSPEINLRLIDPKRRNVGNPVVQAQDSRCRHACFYLAV